MRAAGQRREGKRGGAARLTRADQMALHGAGQSVEMGIDHSQHNNEINCCRRCDTYLRLCARFLIFSSKLAFF